MSEQNDKNLTKLDEPIVDAEAIELEEAQNAQQETPSKTQTTKERKKQEKQRAKAEKSKKTRYVGRVTLGITMIIMGLLITAGLLSDQLDLTKLARLAPLLLVILGVEILAASFFHGDRQVKVGFGMTILCIFIIGGSVAFSILPDVWKEYGPGSWEQMQVQSDDLKRQLFTKLNPSEVILDVSNFGTLEEPRFMVDAYLVGDFDSKEAFSEKAAELLCVLAENEISRANLQGKTTNSGEEYHIYTGNAYAFSQVTGAELLNLVKCNVTYVNDDMDLVTVEEETLRKMKEQGLLADANAMERAYTAGKEKGREEVYAEMRESSTEMQQDAWYEEGAHDSYQKGQENAIVAISPTQGPNEVESGNFEG